MGLVLFSIPYSSFLSPSLSLSLSLSEENIVDLDLKLYPMMTINHYISYLLIKSNFRYFQVDQTLK